MNNNNLGRVSVRTSKRKRQSTPLHFDVNATLGVGSVTPFMLREATPDTEFRVKTRDLIRLATMVVPTYGRLKLNLRHYFVGMGDLTDNFEALMTQQPIARGQFVFTPTKLPNASKGFLSLFSLVGAHVTLYRNMSSNNDTNNISTDRLYQMPVNDIPGTQLRTWFASQPYQNVPDATSSDELSDGDFYKSSMPTAWREAWGGYDGPCLNIAKLCYQSPWPTQIPQAHFWIPIENKTWYSLFDCTKMEGVPEYVDTSIVPLDTADAVIGIRQKGSTVTNGVAHLACRFSNFGQRWYNLLIASGTGVDYADTGTSDSIRSLMPLFAYYKAYWESFGLELYKKWETSEVARMMRLFDDYALDNFEECIVKTGMFVSGDIPSADIPADVPTQFYTYWCNFVLDVCTAFYTEEQDFTSAHTTKAVVSPRTNLDTLGYVVNDPSIGLKVGDSNTSPNEDTNPYGSKAGYPFITGGSFSQLDIETLKRLYKVVNRNTIAGQNIAKLLELQGLGDYVNSCKSRFIGEFNVDIDIDEVTATSDAFDSTDSPRSLLGEQGAKGVGFGASKTFKVSTNEFGYYIVLASIVPESGYVNCALAQSKNYRKLDFYNPEYDGLGMELNAKELTVSGTQDWSDYQGQKLSSSPFGYAPRYSRHKVMTNFALGGFGLRSERGYYRSYFIDKIVDVGERRVSNPVESESGSDIWNDYTVTKLAKVERVPAASPNWRFVGRYPWLENYLRMFADTGDPKRSLPQYYGDGMGFAHQLFDYTFRDADKFIVQNRFVFFASAPWLKITDSYETKEDGNVGSTDLSIGKA